MTPFPGQPYVEIRHTFAPAFADWQPVAHILDFGNLPGMFVCQAVPQSYQRIVPHFADVNDPLDTFNYFSLMSGDTELARYRVIWHPANEE